MRAHYTKRFLESYADLTPEVKRVVDRRIAFLLADLRHPSLRAKKYDAARDIWQARVNGGWRVYFKITGDTYYLLNLAPHPK